jgi:hypothetical protein
MDIGYLMFDVLFEEAWTAEWRNVKTERWGEGGGRIEGSSRKTSQEEAEELKITNLQSRTTSSNCVT